jgi:hypothetical protein
LVLFGLPWSRKLKITNLNCILSALVTWSSYDNVDVEDLKHLCVLFFSSTTIQMIHCCPVG